MKVALHQLPNMLAAIPATLELTALSFLIGAVGGLPLMLIRRSRFRLIRFPAVVVIDLVRGVPAQGRSNCRRLSHRSWPWAW
jgi:His/Glu/Gln/Arg/opine family amino acid ABC transporter permease subunit